MVKGIDSIYGETVGQFFVGFEGSFGSHHVTPRGLSARLLGKLVCIDGIVSRCEDSVPGIGYGSVSFSSRSAAGSLIHPKVVTSVHYNPSTNEVRSSTPN